MFPSSSRQRKRIRLAGLILSCDALLIAQATTPTYQLPLTDRERVLRARIDVLEKRIAAPEGNVPAASDTPRASVLGARATGARFTEQPSLGEPRVNVLI